MIRNFIVTTYRNILLNKFLSVLNIGGLSVGIASFLLIFQYVLWENSYDKFYSNYKDIYRVSQLFLTKSLMVNLLSIVAGLLIFKFSLPYFHQLIGKSIPIDYLSTPLFWFQIILIWIVGLAISGFYTAWVLSSFDPKTALQSSNVRHGHKAIMRKALVIFQFIASTSLIAGTLVVYSQLDFMRSRDKGIVTENVVAVNAPEIMDQEGNYYRSLTTYRDRVGDHSAALSAGLSSDIPGEEVSWMGGSRRIGGKDEYPNTIIYKHTLDINYLNIYENKFLAGRNFAKENDSIYVIINKAAMEAFEFNTPKEAINQRISVSLVDTLAVIGVIDNFHQEKLKEDFKPTVYLLLENERRFFSVKVNNTNLEDFLNYAEITYNEAFPEGVFEYKLLDDHINAQYQGEGALFYAHSLVFAGLAIVIALLGLTGLAFYSTQKRAKEISIRKVLGLSAFGVFVLLSKDMLKNVLCANLLAFPLVVYYSNEWLNDFAFRQEFNYSLLIISLLMTLICALLIIAFHVLKAALIRASSKSSTHQISSPR